MKEKFLLQIIRNYPDAIKLLSGIVRIVIYYPDIRIIRISVSALMEIQRVCGLFVPCGVSAPLTKDPDLLK